MSHNPQRAVFELLRDLFDASELRRFIFYLPQGDSLVRELPGAAVSREQLTFDVTDLLRRRGLLNQHFFDELLRARPLHDAEVRKVAQFFNVSIEAKVTPTSAFVRDEPQAQQPAQVRILLLTSNPTQTMLKLDQEARSIRNAIEASTHRDRFDLQVRQAVRVDDLIPLLLKQPADIVHFSGWGTGTSGLMFANNRDEAVLVEPDSLRRLFSVVNDDARMSGAGREIRCVVLNACLSVNQAAAIKDEVDCVIGMSNSIADDAAIMFATALYMSLAEGRSVSTAFELAQVNTSLCGLAGEGAPRLFERTAGIGRKTTFAR